MGVIFIFRTRVREFFGDHFHNSPLLIFIDCSYMNGKIIIHMENDACIGIQIIIFLDFPVFIDLEGEAVHFINIVVINDLFDFFLFFVFLLFLQLFFGCLAQNAALRHIGSSSIDNRKQRKNE